MGKTRVCLSIDGREYTVISDKSEEYLEELGRFVNRQIKEVRAAYPIASTTDAAVLAAINIADEYLSLKEKQYEFDQRISQFVSEQALDQVDVTPKKDEDDLEPKYSKTFSKQNK